MKTVVDHLLACLGEECGEITRLRQFFDQVKDLADRGLEPLPGTQAAAD